MKSTPPTNEIHTTAIGAIQNATQRAIALTSERAAERAEGVTSAQAEIEQLTAAEVARLEQQLADVREAAARAVEQCAHVAEQTRLERAAQIAAQVFGAARGDLPALIAEFRREPGRQLAVRIREAWDALDALALTELGEALSEHTFATLIVGDVIAGLASTNAISVFGAGIGYGDTGLAHEAVYAFTRKATTPAELQEALAAADLAITKRAAYARSHGSPPSSFHHERLEVRRAHLTTRDLLRAFEQIDQRQAAQAQAEFERSYIPPPSAAEFWSQRVARLVGAA